MQLLLDGVSDYLPNPTEVENEALDQDNERGEGRRSSPTRTSRSSALAFKLEDGRYGQLTYMRVYQGTIAKGDFIVNNSRTSKKRQGRRASCACTRTR